MGWADEKDWRSGCDEEDERTKEADDDERMAEVEDEGSDILESDSLDEIATSPSTLDWDDEEEEEEDDELMKLVTTEDLSARDAISELSDGRVVGSESNTDDERTAESTPSVADSSWLLAEVIAAVADNDADEDEEETNDACRVDSSGAEETSKVDDDDDCSLSKIWRFLSKNAVNSCWIRSDSSPRLSEYSASSADISERSDCNSSFSAKYDFWSVRIRSAKDWISVHQ